MSARQPRWEIVRTADGWHARFRASNGAVIVSSEPYTRRRDAVRAVAIVGDSPSYSNGKDADLVEVRDVDERGAHYDFSDDWPPLPAHLLVPGWPR